MLLWLVIFLNPSLPVDWVARILPTEMAIAEDAPEGEVVGQLIDASDRDSEFEIVAAVPDGLFAIDRLSSEISVVDPTALDFESRRYAAVLVRETRAKTPDPIRTLFVNRLVRDGAPSHQVTRLTAETCYHVFAVKITDVDENAKLQHAAQSPHIGMRIAISGNDMMVDVPNPTGTLEDSIFPHQSSLFDVDPLSLVQAYLDRRKADLLDRDLRERDSALEGQMPDDSRESAARLAEAGESFLVEPSAPPSISESMASDPRPQLHASLPKDSSSVDHISNASTEKSASSQEPAGRLSVSVESGEPTQTQPTSGSSGLPSNQKTQHSALWWLVVALVTSLLCACGILLSQTLYGLELKYGIIRRFCMSTRALPHSEVEQEIPRESRDVYEVLNESDLRLLESRGNVKSSDDAARLMERCLSAIEGMDKTPAKQLEENIAASEDTELESALEVAVSRLSTTGQQWTRSLDEAGRLIEAETRQDEVSAGAASTESASINAPDRFCPVDQNVAGVTPIDEVERLQELIRNEFGIETSPSRNSQAVEQPSDVETTSARNGRTPRDKSHPVEVDLTDFRHIADAAYQQAIQTARVNLRNRRLRSLLMYSSLGCSVVCGVFAFSMTSNESGRFLLISLAIMSLLGYMMSRRRPEELD